MPTPGPWIQPADVVRFASRPVIGGANRPWTTSLTSVDSTTSFGDMLMQGSFIINEEDPTIAEVATSYNSGPTHWSSTVTMLRPDGQFISLAPVPPTSGELSAPHVVGYEYEGGPTAKGVLVSDLTVASWLGFGTWSVTGGPGGGGGANPANVLEFSAFEMIEGTDFALVPATVGGLPGKQVQTLLYPNLGVLASRTILGTDNAGTFGTNNTPQSPSDGFSFTTPSAAPGTFAFVDYHLYVGADLLDASLLLSITPDISVSGTVHPPRYRLLYDYVPQRQYPRNDGLAISTRRFWPQPTSRQFGVRKGPAATFW